MSTPNPSSVIAMLAKFRREQDRQDAAALKQLGGAYAQLYKRLSEKIELEATRIFEQGGENVSRVWVARRLESLRQDMQEELAKYAGFTEGVIDSSVDDVLALGTKHAQGLMDLASAGTRDFVSVEFGKLNTAQIDTIIGFLAKGSPLRQRIAELAGTNTEYVINQITEAIALGYNPYKTANNIKGYLTSIMDTATNGMASVLASAVRLTRTSQIYAYREATRANYQANSDVVTGWQWTATEDELTCFPEGTLIKTKRGLIPIQDVVIGDTVQTHTGNWKKVTNTISRKYSDNLLEVRSSSNKVLATKNHPFLVNRNGCMEWITAADLLDSDALIVDDEFSNYRLHSVDFVPVKSSVFDSNNIESVSNHPGVFSGVPFFHGFRSVPISSVNFQNKHVVWKEKVNGIFPSIKNMLLNKLYTKGFKTQAHVLFRCCLSAISSITARRAKSLMSHSRNNSKLLVTTKTLGKHWRSSASLGAILSIMSICGKSFAASKAIFIDGLCSRAFNRTNIVSIYTRFRNIKIFATNWTFFSNVSSVVKTFFRAISRALFGSRKQELFMTKFADQLYSWFSFLPCSAVWMKFLKLKVTGVRTKLSSLFGTRWGEQSFLSTLRTSNFNLFVKSSTGGLFPALSTTIGVPLSVAYINPSHAATISASGFYASANSFNVKSFHSDIISQQAHHCHPFTTVYNIEVEDDHSYIANGFVVHNCTSCLSMHGTIHSNDEVLDDHWNGRCFQTPVILGESILPETAGLDYFNGLSEQEQRNILGNQAWEAYQAGKFDFSDLNKQVDDPVFGTMRVSPSLNDLIGE